MEIGIIGLPGSGKTTLFNALTKGRAKTPAFGSINLEPDAGVVKVPDKRLDALQSVLRPKRIVPAEVKYVDAGVHRSQGKGLSGELLAYLGKADALVLVVRAFSDDSIPHPEGSIDPARDVQALLTELVLSDLTAIERRLLHIQESLKGAKSTGREALLQEQALLSRVASNMEDGAPIREQSLTDDERRTIESFAFLTAKPMLIVLNIGETQVLQAGALESELGSRHAHLRVVAACARLEVELGELGDAEAVEFRSSMGMGQSVVDSMVVLSHELLGLITFFTIASGEAKAWTVRRGTPAVRAAGKIHSDMQRGFIRAEVIACDDLVSCRSMPEARKRGLVRLEGKNYVVRDGDVITFLFNV
ncbi:MAG: redox-regulated ATPase YchF [Chloroflexi bacterium]|nr:redox-regulated ATPase YchF [Chloroflexota bacterium]